MKRLSIEVQGVKGGNTKTQKIGYGMININEVKIMSVDNFKGYGADYVQREEPIICIFGEDRNDCIFEGTHQQLVNLLNKHKQMLNPLVD